MKAVDTTAQVRLLFNVEQAINGSRAFQTSPGKLWFINKQEHVSYIVLDDELLSTMRPVVKQVELLQKVCDFSIYHTQLFILSEEGTVTRLPIARPTSLRKYFHPREKEWYTSILAVDKTLCIVASATRKPKSTECNCTLSILSGTMRFRTKTEIYSSANSIGHSTSMNPIHSMHYHKIRGMDLIFAVHYYELVSVMVMIRRSRLEFIHREYAGEQELYGGVPIYTTHHALTGMLIYGNCALTELRLVFH